jgi:hypothetical protein
MGCRGVACRRIGADPGIVDASIGVDRLAIGDCTWIGGGAQIGGRRIWITARAPVVRPPSNSPDCS